MREVFVESRDDEDTHGDEDALDEMGAIEEFGDEGHFVCSNVYVSRP